MTNVPRRLISEMNSRKQTKFYSAHSLMRVRDNPKGGP